MVVIYLGMLLLRRSFVLVIFGLLSSRISFLLSALVMSAKSTNGRCMRHLLRCTLSTVSPFAKWGIDYMT